MTYTPSPETIAAYGNGTKIYHRNHAMSDYESWKDYYDALNEFKAADRLAWRKARVERMIAWREGKPLDNGNGL